MGTTVDKLNYIIETKDAIKTALIEKGVDISNTDTFRNYVIKLNETPLIDERKTIKYGASINSMLGDVDDNGVLNKPSTQTDLVFNSVKDIGDYSLRYKFYSTYSPKSVWFPDLEHMSGKYGCSYMFYLCPNLSSVDLSNLTTISGESACEYMFGHCDGLTSVDLSGLTEISGKNSCIYMLCYCPSVKSINLSNLTTISGQSACEYMFNNCSTLTSVDLSGLTEISGTYACERMFGGCSALTSVDLSNLTTISGERVWTNMFGDCTSLKTISFPSLINVDLVTTSFPTPFDGCTNLTEIHFRADAQSTIESLPGYSSKFGASNATIYFDL